MIVGTTIKTARRMTQGVLADMVHVSRELISAVETGRRKLPRDVSPDLARIIDDGSVYMTIMREVSGIGPVFLNNIDNHPLACVMKMLEEMREAISKTEGIIPILINGPGRASDEDRQKLRDWGLECCEAGTAKENAMSRTFKGFAMSLAEVWDDHQQDMVDKEFLVPEQRNRRLQSRRKDL